MGQGEKLMPEKLDSQSNRSQAAEGIEDAENSANPIINAEEEGGSQPRTQRFQLRAAISSVYNTRPYTGSLVEPVSPVEEETNSPTQENPSDEAERENKRGEVQLLIDRAEILTQSGEEERARQIYSQAVSLDPENSEGWGKLGSLLIEQNPERARYCFKRALSLDQENELARLMLERLKEQDQINSARALARIEKAEANKDLQVFSTGDEGESITRPSVKIGVEEALAAMRENGIEADPENLPMGGAKMRSAIESGALKPGRRIPRRRLRLPHVSVSGLALSLFLLISLGLLSGVGLYIVITQPSFEPPPPTPTPPPTNTPIPTLSLDETFGGKLRLESEKYNSYLARAKNLVDQQRANKIQWEEFRKGFNDLQKQFKEEKKTVDLLSASVQPRLLGLYKNLQELSQVSLNGADYMVSGIHNYEPDDLDEALRQFSRANNQLAEVATQLNKFVPLPSATPGLPTPTIVPITSNSPGPASESGTATSGIGTTLNPTLNNAVTPGTSAPIVPITITAVTTAASSETPETSSTPTVPPTIATP